MSARSFMGAEIQSVDREFANVAHSVGIVRDTSIKKNGEASWQLASAQSRFFETAKTKSGVDVVAGCMFWLRTNFSASGRVHRFLTGGDNGGNVGRYYFALDAKVIKLYDKTNTLQGTGSTLTVSTFHHIVVIDDGTNVRLYLDGSTSADITWAHGEGAWNNLSWGPSSVQTSGKAIAAIHWFDDVICFDDQDGRMDWITPSDWDGDTSWRVARAKPTGDVVAGFTPSTAGDHYVLVDDEPDSTADYVWALDAHSFSFIAREGSDYTLSVQDWNFMYDLSPAGNEWTDLIFDGISTGIHDTTDDVKELLNIEDSATIGVTVDEDVRAVRYLATQFTTGDDPLQRRFYVWRDTVLIGPPDPTPPVSAFIPQVMQF